MKLCEINKFVFLSSHSILTFIHFLEFKDLCLAMYITHAGTCFPNSMTQTQSEERWMVVTHYEPNGRVGAVGTQEHQTITSLHCHLVPATHTHTDRGRERGRERERERGREGGRERGRRERGRRSEGKTE